MKIRLDLTSTDLNPEITQAVIQEAHAILDHIFEEKDNLIKCSITVDGDRS